MRMLCIIGLGVAIAGGLSHHLPVHPIEVFAHFQPWVLTLTLALALLAVLRQFAWLALALTAAGIYHLLFALPYLSFDALQRQQPDSGSLPTIRVLQFNINADNPHYDAVAASIEAADADVMIICEATVHVLDRLKHLHNQYPHRIEAARWPRQSILGVSGTVLWSRFPFSDSETLELAQGNIQICRATAEVHGTSLRIYAAHLLAPRSDAQILQRNQGMEAVVTGVDRDRAHPGQQPPGHVQHVLLDLQREPARPEIQTGGRPVRTANPLRRARHRPSPFAPAARGAV